VATVTSLQADNATTSARAEAAEEKARELEATLEATQAQEAELQQSLAALSGGSDAAAARVGELQSELDAAQAASAALEHRLCEATEQVETLDAARAEAATAGASAQEELAAAREEVATLSSGKVAAEEQSAALEARVAALSEAHAEAVATVTSLQADNATTSARAEAAEEKARELEATLESTQAQAQAQEILTVEIRTSLEELQLRERKLKSLLAKQKTVIKTKDDEVAALKSDLQATVHGKQASMELSNELKSRGDNLRRVMDELSEVKAALSTATFGRSEAEGLLEAARRSLRDAEVAASEASRKCLAAEANAHDLRVQFDAYKRRAAAVLARGAESKEPSQPDPEVSSKADSELAAYKLRTSEALRQANEQVARFRAAAQRNKDDDEAAATFTEGLKRRNAEVEQEMQYCREAKDAALVEASAAFKDSSMVKEALVRVTSELEAVTARASSADAQVRNLKKLVEEEKASALASAAEVNRLERELSKAQKQGSFLSAAMAVPGDERVTAASTDRVGGERASGGAEGARPVPRPSTSADGLSKSVTPPHGSDAEQAPSLPEGHMETGNLTAVSKLQTELAEATLKLGDAREKVPFSLPIFIEAPPMLTFACYCCCQLRAQVEVSGVLQASLDRERQLITGKEALRNAGELQACS